MLKDTSVAVEFREVEGQSLGRVQHLALNAKKTLLAVYNNEGEVHVLDS